MNGLFEHFDNWIEKPMGLANTKPMGLANENPPENENENETENVTVNESNKTEVKNMTTVIKESNKNYNEVMKAYGQVYAGYLQSSGARKFTIKNLHVREWKRIFGWMKKNKYIVDFEYGHTFDTACEVTITDFDADNLIYEKYCKGIEKNILG